MSSADGSVRRIHLWSGFIVLGVFLAGAAAGAGVLSWLRPFPPPPPRRGGPPPHLAELELTAEQQAKAQAIFERYRAAVESAVQETFPRVRAAEAQMDGELRAVLTPAQAKKLDQIRARRQPPGPPGPGGPPGMGPPPGPPPPGFSPGPPPGPGP